MYPDETSCAHYFYNPARCIGQRLFEFVLPFEVQANAASLFDAARCFSRLAKLATGPTRTWLYRQKNKCLIQLQCSHSSEITVHHDQMRYPGLLSIQLKSLGHQGLHTHENWLKAA